MESTDAVEALLAGGDPDQWWPTEKGKKGVRADYRKRHKDGDEEVKPKLVVTSDVLYPSCSNGSLCTLLVNVTRGLEGEFLKAEATFATVFGTDLDFFEHIQKTCFHSEHNSFPFPQGTYESHLGTKLCFALQPMMAYSGTSSNSQPQLPSATPNRAHGWARLGVWIAEI